MNKLILSTTILLGAILLSGCQQSGSTAARTTATPTTNLPSASTSPKPNAQINPSATPINSYDKEILGIQQDLENINAEKDFPVYSEKDFE